MKRWDILWTMCLVATGLFAQTQPKDWAKFARYEQENVALLASGTTPDAVFMGNSITERWAKYRPDFFAQHNFVGRGISGQTSAEMLVRFRQDVLQLHPKTVLIMAGTNDVALNNGYIALENIVGNIRSMCELAQLHGISPVICSVPPAVRFGWRKEVEHPEQTIERLNAMLRQCAEQMGIPYLDYWSSLADERHGLPPKWTADEVHPNPECYAEIFEPLALKMIGETLKNRK